jgi:hypothetical protein
MKIRIKGNSVRIRLVRPEVERFGKEGYLEEQTEFGTGTLTYVLQLNANKETLSTSFENNKITMYVPAAIAREWTTTDITGFSHNQEIANGKHLFLLLEKDFKCTDGETPEDQSDNYEHPLINCK